MGRVNRDLTDRGRFFLWQTGEKIAGVEVAKSQRPGVNTGASVLLNLLLMQGVE
jgi:hypothetical protein